VEMAWHGMAYVCMFVKGADEMGGLTVLSAQYMRCDSGLVDVWTGLDWSV
jgi:hypothetical protein